MRIPRFLSLIVVISMVLGGAAWAADCMNGRGEVQRPLWDGYTLQIGPAEGDHVNECFAAVVTPDGKTLFETFGVDATMLRITGRDVNGDGKPDIVLLTHAANSPRGVYSIIGTDPPGLIRQIVTLADLSFEERSEGKVDIATHDTAFYNFEGMTADQVPAPMLFLRMRGKEIYNVSQIYWPEYEREITQAKAKLSKTDIADLKGESPKQKNQQQKDGPSPEELARMQDLKGTVLAIVLDYIYGGQGQQAWKTLADLWPYNDRDRIRAEILRRRMTGVMRDVSQPAPPAAQPTAATAK